MIRFIQWCVGGLILGLIIHFAVIFTIPRVAPNDVWSRVTALGPTQTILTFAEIKSGDDNPLHLDPAMSHATCHVALEKGPVAFNGELPASFWSVAVIDRNGTVVFSTTNRLGDGRSISVTTFTAAQKKDIARQNYAVTADSIMIEVPSNDIFFLVRAWPQTPFMRTRFDESIRTMTCATLAL